jgi:glycosyltransferase involved in cell wall biosynthesis
MPDTPSNDTLLIYAPVPLFRSPMGELMVEAQAVNGLRLWAANFSLVIAMMPLGPGEAPAGWVPLSLTGASLDRVRLEPLPMAYRPDHFVRHLPSTRRRIRELISEARWLSFAIGGLFGDWGAVACYTAHGMGRPFAVWTDRVESEVVRRSAKTGSRKARLKARLTHRPMAALERSVIRRSSLGLFHGRETYDAYAPFCPRHAEIVHDIHLGPADHISPAQLEDKVARLGQGPLRLVYVGRADPMKGPLDWVSVLERAAAMGVDFRASWLGDGSERPEMLARVARAGLQEKVDLPGFVSDRTRVLAEMRGAHAFLFCHLTPESPRCLVEALASGCPLVGYDSAYPRDVIATHGGGVLVTRADVEALARELATLSRSRDRLTDLIRAAAKDGAPFTDEAVFRHRSEVIQRHLGAPEPRPGVERLEA